MKFLITVCMCVGLSAAQQLPNYFQGSFNVPNAPIPSPGAHQSGAYQPQSGAYQSGAYNPGAYQSGAYQQPQPAAHLAAARPQWSPAAAPAQYGAASPAYSGHVQAAPAAAPVSAAPTQYGWNVQHSAPQPQPAQPALIPTQQHAAPAAPQYQRYAAPAAAPAVPQYQPQQYAAPQPQYAPQAPRYSQPAAPAAAPAQAYQAPTSPISAALARPASVHYANIGENLAGDYKFGYRTGNGDSFREETRSPDGTVQGEYGFVDADGKQRTVKYTAGVNGFQVLNDGASPAPAAAAPAHAAPALPQWAQQGAPARAPQQPQWG